MDLKRAAILILAAEGILAVSCGGDDSHRQRADVSALQTQVAQPMPDRVVGVERHCQSGDSVPRNLLDPQHPVAVEYCENIWDQEVAARAAKTPLLPVAIYLEIVVRTPEGAIYRVAVPYKTKVALGDPWPPK